jgi:hypothetical protein
VGGDDILLSFAAQVIDRKQERAAGTLRTGWGLLSPRQLEVWRRKAPRYSERLAELAGAKVTPPALPHDGIRDDDDADASRAGVSANPQHRQQAPAPLPPNLPVCSPATRSTPC